MPDLAALAAAARSLLPPGVAVAATDPTAAAPPLLPGEAIAAIPARLAEYAAGRHAARQAMAELGLHAPPIPMAQDRSPQWPPGLSGSITHSATLCLAAVTRLPRLIGLDLEPMIPLDADLWETILTPAERNRLSATPLMAKLHFCAKEAAYKAQYPRSQTLFDFQTLEITLGPGSFTAMFLHPVPGFATGSTLHGQYTETEGHFLAALTL